MPHPNTHPDLIGLLEDAGFVYAGAREPSGFIGGAPEDWWEVADQNLDVRARFVATEEDGLRLWAFTGNQIVEWDLQLSASTPRSVVAEIIAAAAGHALAESMLAEVRARKTVPGGRG